MGDSSTRTTGISGDTNSRATRTDGNTSNRMDANYSRDTSNTRDNTDVKNIQDIRKSETPQKYQFALKKFRICNVSYTNFKIANN
jgi:hypothetical protein